MAHCLPGSSGSRNDKTLVRLVDIIEALTLHRIEIVESKELSVLRVPNRITRHSHIRV